MYTMRDSYRGIVGLCIQFYKYTNLGELFERCVETASLDDIKLCILNKLPDKSTKKS